jgi:hypothetical protein
MWNVLGLQILTLAAVVVERPSDIGRASRIAKEAGGSFGGIGMKGNCTGTDGVQRRRKRR